MKGKQRKQSPQPRYSTALHVQLQGHDAWPVLRTGLSPPPAQPVFLPNRGHQKPTRSSECQPVDHTSQRHCAHRQQLACWDVTLPQAQQAVSRAGGHKVGATQGSNRRHPVICAGKGEGSGHVRARVQPGLRHIPALPCASSTLCRGLRLPRCQSRSAPSSPPETEYCSFTCGAHGLSHCTRHTQVWAHAPCARNQASHLRRGTRAATAPAAAQAMSGKADGGQWASARAAPSKLAATCHGPPTRHALAQGCPVRSPRCASRGEPTAPACHASPPPHLWCPNSVSTYAISFKFHTRTVRSSEPENSCACTATRRKERVRAAAQARAAPCVCCAERPGT